MHQGLGVLFIIFGVFLIVKELLLHWKFYSKLNSKNNEKNNEKTDKFMENVKSMELILPEIIKKLPWVVVLGLLIIYLGLYMLGVPVPISIIIGNPAN